MRQRSSTGIDHSERAEIVLVDDRMLAKKQDYRWNNVGESNLVFLNHKAKLLEIELGHYN